MHEQRTVPLTDLNLGHYIQSQVSYYHSNKSQSYPLVFINDCIYLIELVKIGLQKQYDGCHSSPHPPLCELLNLNNRSLLDMVTCVCVFLYMLCSADKNIHFIDTRTILAGINSVVVTLLLRVRIRLVVLVRVRLRDYIKVSPHKDGKTSVCMCESGATLCERIHISGLKI